MMKSWMIVVTLGVGLMGGPLLAQAEEEGNAKATRYHGLLVKRPESAILFERFVGAWLDTGTKEGLLAFLKKETEEGGAVDWRVLAAFLEYGGQDEEALAALNAAVEKDGKDGSLRITRAKLQARLLNFEEALKDLEAAGPAAKEGDDAALRGLYLARSGRPDEAVIAWKEVLKARPQDEELREDLIELEVAEGLYDEALATADGLLAITKDAYLKALRRLRKGDILVVAGKREDALKVFEEVLGSTGDNSWLEREVLAQVDRVFVREDDVVGLRTFYDRLRKAFPRRVSLRKGLAVQMVANGETEEAVALFREVLKITPGDRRNRAEFIDLLESAGMVEDAVVELRALMGDKDEPDLLERLAVLEDLRKNKEGLEEVLGKLLVLKSGDASGTIGAARLYDRYKFAEKAEEVLRTGRVKFPDSIEVTEALATFLVQSKRREEALKLWVELAKGSDREGLMRVARSLIANGMPKEAFKVLDERVAEFERDPLLLAQYCQAATQAGEAEKAWPHAVTLVRRAETSTALDGALKVSILMARRLDPEDLIRGLRDANTVGEQCLLSELHELTGEDVMALEILAKAEEGDAGLMVAAQRVRLLERRGDLDQAAAAMRSLLERPKGRRPVHMRRLVDLLAAGGNLEEALKEVEAWKRMAPGDRVAWRRRSEILREMGRVDEAVVELRRAASKFGKDDEEMRGRLAAALVDAGDYREGERIYNKLYEEAENPGAKLKWIVEMVNLARQESRQDELLEDFERRKRANPREVTPLLALSEIYSQLDDRTGQQEALVEAVRRRPGDVKLIGDLARVIERSGDIDKALKWWVEAAKRDPGPDSKRRLADYYFRNGETELGLAELKSIPAESKDPRTIEKTLQALAKNGEWGTLLNYLAGLGEVVNRDWRLRYFQGIALEAERRVDEAREVFRSLLTEGAELPGLRPLQEMKQFNQWVQRRAVPGREKTAMLESYQWNHYNSQAYRYQRNRFSRSGQGVDPVALPGELRELRWMALAHVTKLMSGMEEVERNRLVEAIRAPWMAVVGLETMGQKDLPKFYATKLEKNPEDLKLLAKAVEQVGSNNDFDEKWLGLAATKLVEENPRVALQARVLLLQRSKKDKGEQTAELLDLLEKVDDATSNAVLGHLAQIAFRNGGELSPEERARVADRIEAYLLKVGDAFWVRNWWVRDYLSYRLLEGHFEKAIPLMNRINAGISREQKERGVTTVASSRYTGYSSSRAMSSPQFPGSRLYAKIPDLFQRLFGDEYTNIKAPALTARHRELLKQLEDGRAKAQRTIDRDQLAKHAAGIEDDYLRILILWYCGKKEEVGTLLSKMVEKGQADAILMAAGFAASQEKDLVKAYDLLVSARAKALDRQVRTEVDSHLALLGSKLASREETKGKVNLEEAKRATMRLRRSFRGDSKVQQLAQIMGTLGMQDEMERLLNPRSTRVRVGGASQFASRSYRRRGAGVAKYLTLGDRKGAAMEAAKELRASMRSQNNSDYEFRQTIELIVGSHLGEAVLEILNPGDSKSVSRRLIYSRACIALKKPDSAREVLRQLAVERPKDPQVLGNLASVLPDEERSDALKLLANDDSLEEAGLLISGLFSAAQEEEQMHRVIDLLAELLELLEPSGAAERNLSFAPYYGRHAVEPWSVSNTRLPGLNTALKIPKKNLESDDEEIKKETKELQDRWARRQKVATRLLNAMLRHPQTAKPGFQLLHGNRVGLGREDDSFLEEAKQAVRTQVTLKGQNHRRSDPWTYYTSSGGTGAGTPSSAGLEPMTYLLQHGANDDQKFDLELLALLREAEPDKKELLDLLTAVVSENESEAIAAMKTWEQNLSESSTARHATILDVANFLIMLDLKDGEVMKAIDRLVLDPELVAQKARRSVKTYQSLGEWARKHRGREGLEEVFVKITEGMIGKRETWPAYLELSRAGVLPGTLRSGASSFERFFESIVQNDTVCLEALAFIARNGMGLIADDVRYYCSQSLQKQLASETPEELVEKINKVGLWSNESYRVWGELFEDNQTLLAIVFGQIYLSGNNSQDSRKKLGKALRESKGEGSFLKSLAAATVLRDSSGRDLVAEALHREAAQLKKLPPDQLAGLGVMVRQWIPDLKIEGADEHATELLAALGEGQMGTQMEEARAWLKAGFENDDGNLTRRVGRVIAGVAREDVKMASQLWVRYLKHVREESFAGRSGGSSSGNLMIDPIDYAQVQLYEGLSAAKSTPTDWVNLFASVERSEEAEFLGLGMESYYLDNLVGQALAGILPQQNGRSSDWFFWLKKQWEGIAALPGEDASEGDRGIAACLFAGYLMNRSSIPESEKVLAWLDESKMLERRPFFGRLFRIIAIVKGPPEKISVEQKEEARKLLLEIITDDRIPVRIRTMLAQHVVKLRNMDWLLDSSEGASALVQLLEGFRNGKRQVVSSTIASILNKLSELDSDAQPDELGGFLKNYEPALFGPMAMRSYRRGNGRELFARPMMVLAVRGKDSPAAERMARIGGEFIKGDLGLLMGLAKHGEEKLVQRILAPPGKAYTSASVGEYDEELHATWKLLEVMIPEEKRFRVECLIAAKPDSEEWKKGEGQKRSDRLVVLAKAFVERAPKIRLARLQCLGAIAHVNEASSHIEAEIALETQRWMYGQGLNGRNATPEMAAAQRIILQAMRMSGEKGEIAELKRQLLPLLDLAGTNTNQSYQATNLLRNMGRVVPSLLQGLGDHPDKVAEALPYAKDVLEKCLRTREHYMGSFTNLAIAQAIVVYALAEKGDEFDKMVAGWTPTLKKRYDQIRKQGLRGHLGMLAQDDSTNWSAEESSSARAVVLRSLLMDEATAKRELKRPEDVYQLVSYKAFTYDDVAEALRGIAEDRPEWGALSGNLGMLLHLAGKGDREMIGKLLPGEEQFYHPIETRYDEELKQKSEVLLKDVDESRRYQIECLIAGCVNSKEYAGKVKDNDTQGLRLEKLAAQFAERVPVGGAAREQCLVVLGRDPAAMDLLHDEFIKISKDWDFAAATGSDGKPTQRERARRLVYRMGLLYEVADGNFERAKKQLLALFVAAQGEDKKKAKYALTAASELSVSVARGYLLGMAANPEEARLAFAREVFDASLGLPGTKDKPKQHAEVMMVLGHALVGKGEELYKEISSWPKEKKDAWWEIRKDVWIKLYNVIGNATWINPARKNERMAVLRAILTDPAIAEREFAHMTNLSNLLDGGVVLRDEIYEVVLSLPEDNPRRVECLTEIAGIMAWREKKIAEAMEIYTQAEELAVAGGDEALLSLTRAYHARCLAQVASDQVKAWEFGSKVQVDKLPERDRTWFRKEAAKWKKAAGQ